MEISILSRTAAAHPCATSSVALAHPIMSRTLTGMPAVRVAPSRRLEIISPSMCGMGAYPVPAATKAWHLGVEVTDHCGNDADTQFSTRLGPPSCSPPV